MRTGFGVAGAYEVARRVEQDLAATGKAKQPTSNRWRSRDRGAGRAGRRSGDRPAPALPGAGRAGHAADHPDRRRHRHGQADGCRRGVAYRLGITSTSTDSCHHARAVHARVPSSRSTTRASTLAALPTAQEEEVDPLLHGFPEQTPFSSGYRRRSTGRSRRAGRWSSKAFISCRGCSRGWSRTRSSSTA